MYLLAVTKHIMETTRMALMGAVVVVVVFAGLNAVPSTSRASLFPNLVTASQSQALPPEVAALRLDFGRELAASACDGVGSPIINASQKIVRSVDSGQAGNYWAFDDFDRIIQVWATGEPNEYCASVKYTGSFRGVEGQVSPGATGVLTGKEAGPIQGGYVATINSTLLETPFWDTKGGVGTTDYACDISGMCPSAVNWVTQYFNTDYTFSYEWWGWIYRAGGKSIWVNSSDGNSGDVIK